MPEPILVVTTSDKREELDRIAKAFVEMRLVACAQIEGPITSIYRWQGNVETAEEWRCTFKTDRRSLPALETQLTRLHSYDVPELIVTAIDGGSDDYLQWLDEQLEAI